MAHRCSWLGGQSISKALSFRVHCGLILSLSRAIGGKSSQGLDISWNSFVKVLLRV